MKKFSKMVAFLLLSLILVSCNRGDSKEGENQKIEENNKKENGSDKTVENTKIMKDFRIIFIDHKDSKRELVLAKNDKYDYSIYTLGGNFQIQLDKETLSLKDTLNQGKITVEALMERFKFDISKNIATMISYKDGGSTIITYPEFSVVKLNELNGRKDMYFTTVIKDLNSFKDVVDNLEKQER